MRKRVKILGFLLLLLSVGLQAQEKSIVGLWDFTIDGYGHLLEITENTIGYHSSNQYEYKIIGDKIVWEEIFEVIEKKFRLQDENTLILGDKIATRLEINLDKNRKICLF